MLCCGESIKKKKKINELLQELHDLKNLHLGINLTDFNSELNAETGEWKSKKELKKYIKFEEKVEELEQILYERENKCEKLEKEYLAKVIRLLYMVQSHCNLKIENDNLFEKYGIKSGNLRVELEKILPNVPKISNKENGKGEGEKVDEEEEKKSNREQKKKKELITE